MYTLKNWYLDETYDGYIYARGTVFGHHRLEDGTFIHTSVIMKLYRCSEGEYVAETRSGSLYHLFADEMKPEEAEGTREKMASFKILNGAEMKQEITEAENTLNRKKQMVDHFEQTAREHMDEDGLYLIMEAMHVVKAVRKQGNRFGEIQTSVHLGMIEDSVLITDWRENVDFRYFPQSCMVPYQWSDGLPNVYIHNIGISSIIFQGSNRQIECKAGEVTKIARSEYRGIRSDDQEEEDCF